MKQCNWNYCPGCGVALSYDDNAVVIAAATTTPMPVRHRGPKPGYKMTPKHRAALKKAWAARSRQAAAARKAKGA